MLHTKFRENRPAGSGDFLRVFTIYGGFGASMDIEQMTVTLLLDRR